MADVKVIQEQLAVSATLEHVLRRLLWSASSPLQQLLMSVQVRDPMILCS